MIIVIDTEEALNFALSIQDLAVLDVMRKMLANDKGATETIGNRTYKWLSSKLILQHLQCPSFRSERQLANIIKKLCAVGLLIKRFIYGKPYYAAILKGAKAATAPQRPATAHVQPAAVVGSPAPSSPMSSPSPAPPSSPLSRHSMPTPTADAPRFPRRAPIPRPIPSIAEINDFAAERHLKDFDTEGFIHFNTERDWSALRRTTWQDLALKWYAQQTKKTDELITYTRYLELCNQRKITGTEYTFHHKDPKTGITYMTIKTTQQKEPQADLAQLQADLTQLDDRIKKAAPGLPNK